MKRHLARLLSSTACIALLGLAASPSIAQSPQVTAGQATVAQSGKAVTVRQGSDKAILEWRRLDVPGDGALTFEQPGRGSIALNRVTGAQASAIDGRLGANGQVWIVNPNGVAFGAGARVDVAGIVATTAGIKDQDFLAGRYRFDGAPATGTVTNAGAINVAEGGYAILSAAAVRNSGTITARLGTVALAGGTGIGLDVVGDRLLAFEVTGAVETLAADGQPVVTSSGRLAGEGGVVRVTARTAKAALDGAIGLGGEVVATRFREVDGAVVIDAGDGRARLDGAVHVGRGRVDLIAGDATIGRDAVVTAAGGGTVIIEAARGLDLQGRIDVANPDGLGGTAKLLGDRVALDRGARIDASGSSGGGKVLVGGDYFGRGPERNARFAHVAAGAVIRADALVNGDGGRVVVWSDDTTRYDGQISARGGPAGGVGGFVETSGKVTLKIGDNARVDALAPRGRAGDWLLDPATIVIDAAGGASLVQAADAGDTASNITISPATINGATANVVLAAQNTITQHAGQNISIAMAGVGIEFRAGTTFLNGSVTTNGAEIRFNGFAVGGFGSISTATQVVLNGVSSLVSGSAAINFAGSTTVNGQQSLTINAASGTLGMGSGSWGATTPLGPLTITASGPSLTTLTLAGGLGASSFTASAGTLTVASAITVSGGAANLGFTSPALVQVSNNVTSNGGDVTISGNASGTATGTHAGMFLSSSRQINASGGNISITGRAGSSATAQSGIQLQSASTLTTSGAGTISLIGQSTIGFHGVEISSALVQTQGSLISFNGTGGTAGGNGIQISSSTLSSAGGLISLSGTAASSGGVNGVLVVSGTLSSGAGGISIAGTRGGATNAVNVSLSSAVLLQSTSGNINITGTFTAGGQSTSSSAFGVIIGSGSRVVTDGGLLTVQGVGAAGAASGSNNTGVAIDGTLQATGSGAITVIGTAGGGSSSSGISMNTGGSATPGVVESNSGGISLTGARSANTGNGSANIALFTSGNRIQSTTGSITLTGTATLGSGTLTLGGVNLAAGTITTGGSAITIRGVAGGSADGQGVFVGSHMRITGTGALTNVSLSGTGGNATLAGTTQGFGGVSIAGGTITTAGGTLSITGEAGRLGAGISITSFGYVGAIGSGLLTMNGTGGASADTLAPTDANYRVNPGIVIGSASNAGTVEATGAARVAMTGVGTVGSFTVGVRVRSSALVRTAQGNLDIVGDRGVNSLSGTNVELRQGTITSNGGVITFAATADHGATGGGSDGGIGWGVRFLSASYVGAVGSGRINVNGNAALTANSISAFGIGIDGATTIALAGSAELTLTGVGGGGAFGHGVRISGNAHITGANGAIAINGTRGTASSTGSNVSIESTSISTTGGTISIDGASTAGATSGGAPGSGVFIGPGGQLRTTDGSIKVRGRASASAPSSGVVIESATLETNGAGSIALDGVGGGGTVDVAGVAIIKTSVLRATGGGGIDIVGTRGANAASSSNIFISGGTRDSSGTVAGTGTVLSTTTGAITLNGSAIAGMGGTGFFLDSGADVTSTSGAITATGQGFGTGAGVRLLGTIQGGGPISLSGAAGATTSSHDVSFDGGTVRGTGAGAILVNATGTRGVGFFAGTLANAGGAVTVGGGAFYLGPFTTQSTGGPLSFLGPVQLQATGGTTLTAAGGITFANVVNGATDLVLDAGSTGTVQFQSAVGNTTPLATINVINAASVRALSSLRATAFTQATGNLDVLGAIDLNTLTGPSGAGTVSLAGGVVRGATVFRNTGAVSVEAISFEAGAPTSAVAITQVLRGTITLTGSQRFTGPMRLTEDTTVIADGATLTFDGLIEGAGRRLTLRVRGGRLIINGGVGSLANPLADLTIEDVGDITVGANVGIHATSFSQRAGSGTTAFGTTLFASGPVSVVANVITGNIVNPTGSVSLTAPSITAGVTAATLNIATTSATITGTIGGSTGVTSAITVQSGTVLFNGASAGSLQQQVIAGSSTTQVALQQVQSLATATVASSTALTTGATNTSLATAFTPTAATSVTGATTTRTTAATALFAPSPITSRGPAPPPAPGPAAPPSATAAPALSSVVAPGAVDGATAPTAAPVRQATGLGAPPTVREEVLVPGLLTSVDDDGGGGGRSGPAAGRSSREDGLDEDDYIPTRNPALYDR
jgi:filamentous hemagglutinin family protein